MSLVLGIDGGGTNTRASIVDGDKVLGHATGGSIKRLRVGAEAAEASLRAILKEAFAQAAVPGVKAACCGVASATMPGITEWITAVFNDFGVERSEVVGDEVIALDAAFKGGPGILQIAGTGSNTIGRGTHSLRRALHAYDREEPTQILTRVQQFWGAADIDELINIGDGTPAPDFAALCPLIDELAEAGDPVAQGVLAQAAQDLITFVLLVRSKLRRKHNIAGEVPVAWTGSVIEKMRQVREPFFAGLKAAAPEMPVFTSAVVSLEGAVWRAQRIANS
jgi:N-acetylglucosamine kinase-like BadF-type ATPase